MSFQQRNVTVSLVNFSLILAVLVIPFVGSLSDKVGRRPPMIVGMLAAGLLSYSYLYAISVRNVPLAIGLSLLMWGRSTRVTTLCSRVFIRSFSERDTALRL